MPVDSRERCGPNPQPCPVALCAPCALEPDLVPYGTLTPLMRAVVWFMILERDTKRQWAIFHSGDK